MTAKSPRMSSFQIVLLIAASFLSSIGAAQNADQAYRTPPLDIADIVDAQPTPAVSVDPAKSWMLILGVPESAWEEVARPWIDGVETFSRLDRTS